MSLESAKNFVEKMQEDDDFAKSFFTCKSTEEKRDFIKEKGFDFTKEEMEEAMKDLNISGGSCCGQICESDRHSACTDV